MEEYIVDIGNMVNNMGKGSLAVLLSVGAKDYGKMDIESSGWNKLKLSQKKMRI
jgi:hypothetical protein